MKMHHARVRRTERKLAVSFAYGLHHAIERVLRDHPDEVTGFKRGDVSAVAVISGIVHRDLVTNGFLGPYVHVRDRVESLMMQRYVMN